MPEDSQTEPNPSPNAGSEPATASEQQQAQAPEAEQQPETFDRAYVERLRSEAAAHRTKAKRADALAARLATAYAAQSGRLADPSDLPLSDDCSTTRGSSIRRRSRQPSRTC